MKIEVENCYGCPFQNSDQEDGYTCRHKDGVEDYEMTPYEMQNKPHIPNNCPLRNEDVLVTIKNK